MGQVFVRASKRAKAYTRRTRQGFTVVATSPKGGRSASKVFSTLREAVIAKGHYRRGNTKGILPGFKETYHIKPYWGK